MTMTETENTDETDPFEEYKQFHLAKKNDGTAATRESHVKQFRQWCDEQGIEHVGDVTPRHVEKHLIEMMNGGGYADRTVRVRYDSLVSFFTWAVDTEGTGVERHSDDDSDDDSGPVEGVDITEFDLSRSGKKETAMGEQVVFLEPHEVETLVDPENVPDPVRRNELLIRMLYQTGVRAGELQNIRLKDIDRDERSIKIRGKKTDSTRKVYYQPSLDKYLSMWLDSGLRDANATADESPYLLLTYKKEKLRHSTIRDVVKAAAENAGIQEAMYEDAAGNTRWKVTPHILRHSHAVQAVRAGMDIQRLAYLMGHTDDEGRPNLDTTRVYLQFKDEAMRDAARKFGPSV